MLLTIRCGCLFLGFGGVANAPDDVTAIGVGAHELCTILVPGQRLKLLKVNIIKLSLWEKNISKGQLHNSF